MTSSMRMDTEAVTMALSWPFWYDTHDVVVTDASQDKERSALATVKCHHADVDILLGESQAEFEVARPTAD